MDEKLERMIEEYRHSEIQGQVKRCLWYAIKDEIEGCSNALYMRVFRAAHPERALEQYMKQKDRLKARKLEVLTHYGNGVCACVRCGFYDIRALSIDHINGGGTRHRKINNLRSSQQFYAWLKTEKFPEGYQTLCMNCQWIKRFEQGEHNSRMVDNLKVVDWQTG